MSEHDLTVTEVAGRLHSTGCQWLVSLAKHAYEAGDNAGTVPGPRRTSVLCRHPGVPRAEGRHIYLQDDAVHQGGFGQLVAAPLKGLLQVGQAAQQGWSVLGLAGSLAGPGHQVHALRQRHAGHQGGIGVQHDLTCTCAQP